VNTGSTQATAADESQALVTDDSQSQHLTNAGSSFIDDNTVAGILAQ